MTWILALSLMLGQSIPDSNALYQDGLAALRAQNWTLATEKLSAKQFRAPDAMTSYLLAVAYSHQNRYLETENAARKALQMSPALTDQFRNPAARLLGWAQAMKTNGDVSVQYTMSNPPRRPRKDLEAVAARPLPEDGQIENERETTLKYLAANDPCANKTGLQLTGCRMSHAHDPAIRPATRLP